MDGSRDLGNIFSPDLYGNSIQDGAVSLMDLPLNLLALIIIYVSVLNPMGRHRRY